MLQQQQLQQKEEGHSFSSSSSSSPSPSCSSFSPPLSPIGGERNDELSNNGEEEKNRSKDFLEETTTVVPLIHTTSSSSSSSEQVVEEIPIQSVLSPLLLSSKDPVDDQEEDHHQEASSFSEETEDDGSSISSSDQHLPNNNHDNLNHGETGQSSTLQPSSSVASSSSEHSQPSSSSSLTDPSSTNTSTSSQSSQQQQQQPPKVPPLDPRIDIDSVLRNTLALPYVLYPPCLFSHLTCGPKNIPLFAYLLTSEYPWNCPAHNFSSKHDSESHKYDEEREQYIIGRIQFLTRALDAQWEYQMKIHSRVDKLQKKVQRTQMENVFLQSIKPFCEKRMKEVQLYLTKIISNYIDGVYEYNDGSMYADLKLTMNTIKTKLSSSTLTSTTMIKAAQMMQLMLGLEDVSEKQTSIIEETSGSKQPKPNENTSPYAVYCRELDVRREEMKFSYANNPHARNVVEARCEKLDEFYSSKYELGKGVLCGDIFVTKAESVMVYVGGINGKLKFTKVPESKNANNYCIDIKKNTVLVTSPKCLQSYKINTNPQLETSFSKEFTINASNDNMTFGPVTTLDGLVAVADGSQNVVYCYSPYTKKPSHGFKLPVYENNRSIYMMKFHPMTRTLFTASSNVIFSVFMENRFYDVPFVGFGSTVTDFCFDPTSASVLLASCADRNVYLFDYRQQVSPILKLQGHADRVEACDFSLVGGVPFVWSAGYDESIRCWDLRMQAPLYELSTGNGRPLSIHWHDSSSTLLCNAAFDHCNSEEWPETAIHNRKHFSRKFSITSSAIIRYQFKDSIPFNASAHSSARSPVLGGSSSVSSNNNHYNNNHSTHSSSKKSSQKSKRRK